MPDFKLGLCVVPFVTAFALNASTASAQEADGPRFRGGISAGGGGLFFSGYTFGLGGIDGRLGVQINNLLGVYAQPYVSFGSGNISGATGLTGTAGTNLMVDFTFIDQIFVGAGGGGGIIGTGVPAGQLHLRAGGYPLMRRGDNGIRRRGLMLGADMSVHFASGVKLLQPMLSIGYEAY
jgi:hypothetical protein